MDPDFWRARWREGQIGFHLARPNPNLERHLERLRGADRVLVPLCGKSVDLPYLRAMGFQPTGLELVEDALRAMFREAGIEPERTSSGGAVRLSGGGITTYAGDFFGLTAEMIGRFPRVWDRAALVALPPALRPKYVDHLLSLVEPGGRILLVSFEYEGAMGGPPFSVPEAEIARLFGDRARIERLEANDILDQEPRFLARGLTRLVEAVSVIEVR